MRRSTTRTASPWLALVGEWLAVHEDGGVMGCSALKRKYRDQIRHHAPNVRFIYLEGSRDVIARSSGGATRPLHAGVAADVAVRDPRAARA